MAYPNLIRLNMAFLGYYFFIHLGQATIEKQEKLTKETT